MKRSAHLIALGLSLSVFTACEVEFDFKELDGDPLFLLDGSIVTGSHDRGNGSLQMYLYAVPAAAGPRDFPEDARCTLNVYRNGELMDTRSDITVQTFYGLVAGQYPVEPGDEVLVTAESGGFPTASARTVIPQSPPVLEDVSFSLKDGILNISFAIEDDASSEDAYSFRFRTVTWNTLPEDDVTGYTFSLTYGSGDGYPIADTGPFDVCWKDGETYYGIFDDSFNGMRKEFKVTAPFEMPSGNDDPYFRIEIQRISPERLRYETACADKGHNILGFIGLAPVTFAYTNVDNGAGCFSGGNSAYSDWQLAE